MGCGSSSGQINASAQSTSLSKPSSASGTRLPMLAAVAAPQTVPGKTFSPSTATVIPLHPSAVGTASYKASPESSRNQPVNASLSDSVAILSVSHPVPQAVSALAPTLSSQSTGHAHLAAATYTTDTAIGSTGTSRDVAVMGVSKEFPKDARLSVYLYHATLTKGQRFSPSLPVYIKNLSFHNIIISIIFFSQLCNSLFILLLHYFKCFFFCFFSLYFLFAYVHLLN
jgi:hypothetical protein